MNYTHEVLVGYVPLDPFEPVAERFPHRDIRLLLPLAFFPLGLTRLPVASDCGSYGIDELFALDPDQRSLALCSSGVLHIRVVRDVV